MDHQHYMQRCLQLAALGSGNVAPNPMVGCVIVHNGQIIGEGYHQKCGEAHAEVNAINSVKDRSLLPNSTVYVSLEPCAHDGKTPPCAELLVSKKVKRVVIATLDPHDVVAGKGVQMLKDAGIDVTVGILEAEARYLARRFFTFYQKLRPYIVLKWAETDDGFMDRRRTDPDQRPLKISGEESDVYTHTLRASEHAILIGTQTALLDDPTLTVRNAAGPDPIRIVLDRSLRLPSYLKVFKPSNKETVVINDVRSGYDGNLHFFRPKAWNLNSILDELLNFQVQSVLVEGGAKLLNSFIAEGLWDEAHCIRSENILAKDGPKSPCIKGIVKHQFRSGSDTITVYQNPTKN